MKKLPINQQRKPGNIGATIQMTDEQAERLKQAVKHSPDITKLSEPFITDGGRTMIYFRKGANVQAMGERFINELNKPIRL